MFRAMARRRFKRYGLRGDDLERVIEGLRAGHRATTAVSTNYPIGGEAYRAAHAANQAILELARQLTGTDTTIVSRGHSTPPPHRDDDGGGEGD